MNPFTTWGVAISQKIFGILSIFVELLYKDYIARVFMLIIIIYAVLAQRKIKLGFLFRQNNRSIILKNLLQRCLEIFLANLFVISLNDNHFHFRFIFISRRVTIGLAKDLNYFSHDLSFPAFKSALSDLVFWSLVVVAFLVAVG
jgi:uncharacterized metal-binding protein